MPGYMVFYKYTQQGIATIKQGPERTKQTRAEAEKMGIRMVGVPTVAGSNARFHSSSEQILEAIPVTAAALDPGSDAAPWKDLDSTDLERLLRSLEG